MLHQQLAHKGSLPIVLLVLFLFCVTSIFFAIVHSPQPVFDTVAAKAGQGAYAVIVRLPAIPTLPQEEVIIHWDDPQMTTPRHVIRGPVDNTGATWADYTVVQLSDRQWRDIDTLRHTWCQQPPAFRKLQPDEPFYDVGLDCEFLLKRVKVPVDALPTELTTLLAHVPAPTEKR